jgi:hypothetical protein
MAKQVFKNCYVNLAGTDMSANVNKVEFTDVFEEKDVTTFGSNGAKEVLAGLESGTVALTFRNDFAAGSVDSIMWGLRGTVVTFEVRPTQAVRGTSNPSYTGNVLVKEWKPISGAPGDVADVSVSYSTSGPSSRLTA